MATLAVKIVLFMMVARGMSERPAVAECKGKSQLGEPCQNGEGICTEIDEQGERYGQMECVKVQSPSCKKPLSFDTTAKAMWPVAGYPINMDAEWCFTAPDGTNIDLFLTNIEIECSRRSHAICADTSDCPYDWLEVVDDGNVVERFCGTYPRTFVGLSNYVLLRFHSDDIWSFNGFSYAATNA